MNKIDPTQIGVLPDRQIQSRDVVSFFETQRGKEFLDSVRIKGVIDPIDVYEATESEKAIHGKDFSLKHGLHRLQGAILMQKEVPYVLCPPPSEREVIETNFNKNLQRGMSTVEKADWMEKFIDEWKKEKKRAPTTKQICSNLGLSEDTIATLKRHIKAPAVVREALRNADISHSEAREIAREAKDQEEVAQALVEEAVEKRGGAKCRRGGTGAKRKSKPKPPVEEEPDNFYDPPEERGDQYFEESIIINSDMSLSECLEMFIDTLIEVKGYDEDTIKNKITNLLNS